MALLDAAIRDAAVGPPRARLLAALLAMAATGTGCLVLEHVGWKSDRPAFSHRLHVVQEEMYCEDCHIDWADADEPGMPSELACMLCHEDLDQERPPERRIAAFFGEDGFLAANVNALSEEVVFSHLAHVTDEEACADCHAAIATSDRIEPRMALGMDDCVACHEGAGAPSDCSACHSELDVDVQPWTHGSSWAEHHGLAVRDRSDLTVDSCQLCHQESTCVSCHLEQPPANHGNFWRRRGHGLTASLDRQNCAACHQQESCDRCHAESVPVSHRGRWGGTRSNHCYSCHLGSSDDACSLCHEGTPSHALAPLKPPGHDPMSACRECHPILSHADKGDDCNACHF